MLRLKPRRFSTLPKRGEEEDPENAFAADAPLMEGSESPPVSTLLPKSSPRSERKLKDREKDRERDFPADAEDSMPVVSSGVSVYHLSLWLTAPLSSLPRPLIWTPLQVKQTQQA
jgi:hypothetical protein